MNTAKLFNTRTADVESDFRNEFGVYQDGILMCLESLAVSISCFGARALTARVMRSHSSWLREKQV